MSQNALNILDQDGAKPWYSEGLRFKCTECGQCCSGTPGFVWITEEEIHSIATALKITPEQFCENYVRKVGERLSLKENQTPQDSYDCVFLKDKKCTIYSYRPKQCRTFPWWPQNLASKEAWEEAATYCEGINALAPVVPAEHINSELNRHNGPSSN